jgi:hypothetical protein
MSSAVAAARKRRAGIQSAPTMGMGGPPQNNPVGQPMQQNGAPGAPPQNGLTLQQVINVINGRLLTLETAEKERKEREAVGGPVAAPSAFSLNAPADTPLQDDEVEIPIGEILSDYNQRFEILTQELADLKNLVLKLQSYTMDVNRTLLEDRFVIPTTDFGEVSNSVITVDAATNTGVADVDADAGVSEPVFGAAAAADAAAPAAENITIQVDGLSEPTVEAPLAPVAGANKKKGGKNVSISL